MPPSAPPPPDSPLDLLVPPPWPPRRRVAAGLLATVAVGLVGACWFLGVFGPNLAPVRGYGFGALDGRGSGAGAVELELALDNRGVVAVRDLEVQPTDFTAGALTQPGGPVDLAGRARGQVRLVLTIDDCSRFRAPPEPGLSFRAIGGILWAQERDLRLLASEHAATVPTWEGSGDPHGASWWYEVAQAVCDPEGMLEG